ncbi:MAG: DUF456 domain-containing protein [Calditrichia bacterium]
MENWIFLIISLIIMIAGLIGTVLPLLPGIPLIYVGYVIYGFASHWQYYGLTAMIVWGAITLLIIWLDYYAGPLGAKKFGASSAGVWGSIIGGILGIVFLGLIGIIAGPFLGAVIGELLAGRNQRQALRSGWGTFVGFIGGSLFKIIVGLTMIGSFLWWVILK